MEGKTWKDIGHARSFRSGEASKATQSSGKVFEKKKEGGSGYQVPGQPTHPPPPSSNLLGAFSPGSVSGDCSKGGFR